MHATEHKRDACSVAPWDAAKASRRCEHGDSPYKAARKATARKKRRSDDKREAQR